MHLARAFLADAHHPEGPGARLQVVREVLAAEDERRGLHFDVGLEETSHEGDAVRRVREHGVPANVVHLDRPVRIRRDHVAHFLLQCLGKGHARLFGEEVPGREPDGPFARPDVGARERAGRDAGRDEDATILRIQHAPLEPAECVHDIVEHVRGIPALVRPRHVSARALDRDLDAVRVPEHDAGPALEHAGVDHRVHVQAVDGLNAGEHAIFHEHGSSGRCDRVLLGALPHEPDVALRLDPAPGGDGPERAEQHGRVAVVPAGVHDACVFGGEGESRRLLDRERVHVRAEQAGGQGRVDQEVDDQSAAHFLDYEVRAVPAVDVVHQRLDVAQGRGLLVGEPQSGVTVQIAPHVQDESLLPPGQSFQNVCGHVFASYPFKGVKCLVFKVFNSRICG